KIDLLIEREFDEAVGLAVVGDRLRLEQVLLNLIGNAVKFTPQGGKIVVRLSRVGNRVCVSVSDSGCGISAEFLPHVFEPYFAGAGNPAELGVGLGLAIAQELVGLHGGTIEVESPGEGRGSTFTV